jgi:hypothetical protein
MQQNAMPGVAVSETSQAQVETAKPRISTVKGNAPHREQ